MKSSPEEREENKVENHYAQLRRRLGLTPEAMKEAIERAAELDAQTHYMLDGIRRSS